MASLKFIIGIIGNITAVLVFASPIKTFWWVVKKKSTENYNGIPYIATLLNASLWTFYGHLKPGGLLLETVNGIGVVLQLIFVTLFVIYAPQDMKVKTAYMVGIFNVVFPGSVIAITLLSIHERNKQLTIIGILCVGLAVGMYASPLLSMKTVIKTMSVKYMPFSLSFFLFLNAGIWCGYSILTKDCFVGVPNAVGFALGLVQLIIYAIYKYKSKVSDKPDDVMKEEGPTQLVKVVLEVQVNDEEAKL
ncbi:bidirectional sugar transporter SWEET16-like [Castanea sativa]|uniref:bidirectional sugar transporter SWEET16-like n=1 Tax=Castanea sativa TaxID=21020 RepID=UPI003F64FAF2